MNLLNKIYQIFLSEFAKRRIEKTILYVALFGFFIHLILIYLSKFGVVNLSLESELFKNPISEFTPHSHLYLFMKFTY